MPTLESGVRTLEAVDPNRIPYEELLRADEPVVLPGLVKNWALTRAGMASTEQAMSLLRSYYQGQPLGVFIGPAQIRARFFYNQEATGLNFESKRLSLDEVLEQVREAQGKDEHPYLYINSMSVDAGFPGLRRDNDLSFEHPAFEQKRPLMNIWLGTESIASAHYDLPNNIACCVLGRRRFILFPPEQIHNLYPGPLDPTPGGQVVTMVDLNNPDFERFPRARRALEQARVIDLEPGDALYYPSMWWHQVEARDSFNIMINYWWLSAPAYMGNPMDIVLHAMMGLRDRPASEKRAWREVMDYYVFGAPEQVRAHLPEAAQGPLAPMDESRARRLRALLLNRLNR